MDGAVIDDALAVLGTRLRPAQHRFFEIASASPLRDRSFHWSQKAGANVATQLFAAIWAVSPWKRESNLVAIVPTQRQAKKWMQQVCEILGRLSASANFSYHVKAVCAGEYVCLRNNATGIECSITVVPEGSGTANLRGISSRLGMLLWVKSAAATTTTDTDLFPVVLPFLACGARLLLVNIADAEGKTSRNSLEDARLSDGTPAVERHDLRVPVAARL